jgi:hypothetical protein
MIRRRTTYIFQFGRHPAILVYRSHVRGASSSEILANIFTADPKLVHTGQESEQIVWVGKSVMGVQPTRHQILIDGKMSGQRLHPLGLRGHAVTNLRLNHDH